MPVRFGHSRNSRPGSPIPATSLPPPASKRISAMSATAADGAFASGRGLRFKQRGVHVGKIFQFQSWDFLANEMFDCLQSRQFFAVHESKRVADILRPAGAPDAVHIIFRMLRHIVIDHVTYAGDVEAA